MNDRDQTKDQTKNPVSDESVADGDKLLVGIDAFQKAFKGHGAVMYVVDLSSFSIVAANEAALKFYGYDQATMLTKRIPDLNVTSEQEIRAEIEKAVDEGRSYYIYKHRLSSGELRDVEIYANPISIRGKDYSFSIVHDITDRRRAEEAVKESEEKYRGLFENAPDGVTVIDSKGYIVDCNTIDQTLIGLNQEEMIGKHITTYLSDESKPLFSKRFLSLRETGMIEVESTLINNRGDMIPVWRKATAMYDNRGDFSGAIVHTRDISERKKIEEEREILLKEIQKALENVKTLSGLLPICAKCNKIRDDKGYWNNLEAYIEKHSDASFSHGMCSECSDNLYGSEDWYIEMKDKKR